MEQVYKIADAIEPRYQALVLLAAFSGLRFGELAALTVDRIDLKAKTVKVTEAASELNDGSRIVGPPKAEGYRTVAIPPSINSRSCASTLRRLHLTGLCSLDRRVHHCGEVTSTAIGAPLWMRLGSVRFTSTIFATPAIPSLRRREQAPRN